MCGIVSYDGIARSLVRTGYRMKSITVVLAILVASICPAAVVAVPSPARAADRGPDLPPNCSKEAKLCPDGTSVSRSGPRCEFTPCPGAGTGSGNRPEPLDKDGEQFLLQLTCPPQALPNRVRILVKSVAQPSHRVARSELVVRSGRQNSHDTIIRTGPP
jgi:hypothetical protein